MNKKECILNKVVLLFVSLLFVTALIISFNTNQVSGLEFKEIDKLFTNASGIDVFTDSEAPETFKTFDFGTVERDFDLGMNGVLLSSQVAGSSIDLTEKFSGSFEMSFRVYSETSHHDESGTDFKSRTKAITPYADLREVAFDFTDEDGEQFTVLINAGEYWNTITPAARVRIYNADMGNHYYGDSKMPEETTLKNSFGYYTRIGGTTFANVTYRGGLTSEKSMPVTFGFNADTMEIYVLHYGTNKIMEPEYRVVLDLDDPSVGLRRISEFKDYSVSIHMNDIAEGKTGNMIIYDINNQELSGTKFHNTTGPVISYSVNRLALSGEAFVIDTPKAFDLLEGKLPFNGNVQVYNQESEKISLYSPSGDLVMDDKFVEGTYFTPEAEGLYTIVLQGVDSAGLLGEEKRYQVQFVREFIDSTYEIQGDYTGLVQSGLIGLNSELMIYPALVDSGMHLNEDLLYADVTLLKDGVVYKDVDDVNLQETYKINLNDTGNYTLVYSTPDFNRLGNVYEIDFSVSPDIPVFTMMGDLNYFQAQGSKIILPNVHASLNDTNKNTTKFVYGPTGERIDIVDDMVSLTNVGRYQVVYMVNLDKTYKYTKYFYVGYATDNLFKSETRTGEVSADADSDLLFPNKLGGIKLSASQNNDTFTYQKIVDVSQNTKNDSLIELMVLPSNIGEYDFWQFTVQLKDIYNPKNVVNILVYKGDWGNEWSYVKAGANKQVPAGWEMDQVLTFFNTGTPIAFSFSGESIVNSETINLSYDNLEKAVYVDNIKRPGYAYENQVIDFDSTDCFPENLLWDGFTTGEVELSVTIQFIQSGNAEILINSVNGVDVSGTRLVDDEAPNVFVDLKDYDVNTLPEGEVNKAYPIFPAIAYDKIDGTLDYEIRVFKDYQTINQEEYAVNNETFTPDKAGNYSIVYQATDSAGNVKIESVLISISDNLAPLEYVFKSTLANQAYVGTSLEMPDGSAIGGSGEKIVSINIKSPVGKTIEPIDNTFRITEVGNYTISVRLIDYLGEIQENTYTVAASYSTKPIISDISIRPVFINGIEYQLPDFEAYDYYTNPGEKQVAKKRVEVTINGVTETLGKDFRFTPNVLHNGQEITITYIAQALGSNETNVVEFKANVVDVTSVDETLDLGNFFYQKHIVSVTKSDSYIDYFINNDSQLVFANPLIANQLNFQFSVPVNNNNYSAIVVTLSDSENPDISVDITIEKNKSLDSPTSYIRINNGERIQVTGSFYEITTYGFNLKYNANSHYLIDENNNKLLDKINKTNQNEVFNGFPSGKVFLSYSFGDVEANSAIRIITVGNQLFSNDTMDRIRPQIELKSFLLKVGEINESFVAPGAFAGDILDPNVNMTLTIRNSKGIVYEGAIEDDYVFVPSEYGIYRFIYSAVDSANRKLEITYLVLVKDRIPPEINLEGDVQETAIVNKDITLPSASVTDNFDEDVKLWIFVSNPEGQMKVLEDGVLTFTPLLSGEYTIRYYAQDSYHAYVFYEYTILVGEEAHT